MGAVIICRILKLKSVYTAPIYCESLLKSRAGSFDTHCSARGSWPVVAFLLMTLVISARRTSKKNEVAAADFDVVTVRITMAVSQFQNRTTTSPEQGLSYNLYRGKSVALFLWTAHYPA